MNKRRIAKWIIVVFLLAALPGLTAVMAQGQEPEGKDEPRTPAIVELGESLVTIPFTNHESEPNNDATTADSIVGWNNVSGGVIQSDGDVDYWRISRRSLYATGRTREMLLVNVDARSFGSPLDSLICLFSDDGFQLACNDDMQGASNRDSLLYYNLEEGRSYYLKISAWDGQGGSDYRYQLLISEPMLISAAAANLGTGYVDGIAFKAADVLAWSSFEVSSVTYRKWVMLLDMSDLSAKGNITNVAAGWRNSDYLLVGFTANATVPGISGLVTPWEVVVFDPTQVGPNTVGTFQRWWDGRQHGLTTNAEKIDAIDWPDWNGTTRLAVSTTGTASVTGISGTLKLADEDVGLWAMDSNKWVRAFDGHTTASGPGGWLIYDWGLAARDVVAYSSLYCSDSLTDFKHYYTVVNGNGDIVWTGWDVDYPEMRSHTLYVHQKGVTEFSESHDEDDNQYPSVVQPWDGPANGWNYSIDAIDYVRYRENFYYGYEYCE